MKSSTLKFFVLCFVLLLGEYGMSKTEIATFAGGCFWCMQPPFDDLKSKGVIKTKVGYMGGHTKNPTYKEVSNGDTGHRESIEIEFDPSKIEFKEILNVFWKNIDPYNSFGQFCDNGDQYRAAIYYQNEKQKEVAQKSFDEMKKIALKEHPDQKFAVDIFKAGPFYLAEEEHQDFYKKNSLHYKSYRKGCGRDKRLKEVWK